MTSFPVLSHYLVNADCLVFFDFEGTQFTHKAIALGVVAIPKKPGELFSSEKPLTYESYIRCSDEIGKVVTSLTGITSFLLVKKGESFYDVVRGVTKILRPFKQKKYISYGQLDMKILANTYSKDDETERNFYAHVKKNYLDFHHYLEKRIVDEKGQSLSVERLCKLYSLKEKKLHDPLSDSMDLMNIYLSYVHDEERAVDQVLSHYPENPYTEKMDKKLVRELIDKKTLSYLDLRNLIKECL